MRLIASDFYTYYRPSKCDLRLYLRHHATQETPPGPYEVLIRKLGQRHEQAHLASFAQIADLTGMKPDERESATRKAIADRQPVIYQPLFRATATIEGVVCEVWGEPDFLIYEAGNYVIRDVKMSRRINEKDHPEIFRQLQFYSWLYHEMIGARPARLEVFNGAREVVPIADNSVSTVFESLVELFRLKSATSEPYSPVGWSKCGDCSFRDRCWTRAENTRDVALVAGVDQGLAKALYHAGIKTVDHFITAFDESRLATFQRPWGKSQQRVGSRARAILRAADAYASGREVFIASPQIPKSSNYVMFDLEGLPPQLDDIEKVYLWGLQIFGQNSAEFDPALAGFGTDGDRNGWRQFLSKAKSIFDKHGYIPFVHWHHYERVRIDMYIDRYGDVDGIAERVKHNLLDLLPITQNSLALPLPSYSLKVVEKYIGFKRTQHEYGGDWSIANYIEAIETEDEKLRGEVMDQILTYNKEDLAATWAVLCWLKGKSS
jgi:predicted RecB family nuclease